MVILTLSKKFNQWLGPFLLRKSIQLRYSLGNGVISDNRYLDSFLLLPLAQKLISLEVYEESKKQIRKEIMKRLNKDKSLSDPKNDVGFLESDIRLRILEKYLRPALVPSEQWSDIRKWQFYKPVLKWTRKEYLLAKYASDIRSAVNDSTLLQKSPQVSTSISFSKKKGNRRPLSNLLRTGTLSFDNKKTDDEIDDGEGQKINNQPLMKLPTSAQIMHSFGMKEWDGHKDLQATFSDMSKIVRNKLGGHVIQLRGGSIRFAVVPDNCATTSDLSLSEILEVAGGHVTQCGPFNALCEELDVYQFWTRDYIEHLGRYLQQKANSYFVDTDGGETLIIDVGAGDGILAQCLREYFESATTTKTTIQQPTAVNISIKKPLSHRNKNAARNKESNKLKNMQIRLTSTRDIRDAESRTTVIPTVIATDNGSWKITEKADVEGWDVEETLDRYRNTGLNNSNNQRKQIIVICSWMPMYEDWTELFRQAGVDEYILIGEYDDGQCGDNWKTWGNIHFCSDEIEELDDDASQVERKIMAEDIITPSSQLSEDTQSTKNQHLDEKIIPPYVLGGYQRYELTSLTPHQFSRFDCRVSKTCKTFSFQLQK